MRSRRSQRPSLAARGARASTFGAGLEQAEQLWAASDRVGPVASPILLFYGLTQAGRAICAAGIASSAWEPSQSHGLSFKMSTSALEAVPTLSSVVVTPHGAGLVQQVAEVLGSPVLADPVTLAELLSALDVELYFEGDDLPGVRPLEVQEDGMLQATPREPPRQSLYIGPLPDELAASTEIVPAGPQNLAYTRRLPPSGEQINNWLAPYPRLSSLGQPASIGAPEHADDVLDHGSWAIRLGWDGPGKEANQTEWTVKQLDVIHSSDWGLARGIVLPAIGGNTAPQTPLVTWWLALYALSMLARYKPREWTAMIDVDRSRLAVPLEQFLATTTPVLLELVVDALDQLAPAG